MLKVDSNSKIQNVKFSSNPVMIPPQKENTENNFKDKNGKKIMYTLTGLATLGMVALGIKTSPQKYEEVLKKSGIEIKNGMATLISTGEKYTGKVERYETRNKKETVEFVNGIITEKIYHNAFGKELEGYFYKNGVVQLKVGRHVGRKNKSFPFSEYKDEKIYARGDIWYLEIDSVFDWAREKIRKMK